MVVMSPFNGKLQCGRWRLSVSPKLRCKSRIARRRRFFAALGERLDPQPQVVVKPRRSVAIGNKATVVTRPDAGTGVAARVTFTRLSIGEVTWS